MGVGGAGSGFPGGSAFLPALVACLGFGCAAAPERVPDPVGLAALLGEMRVAAVAVAAGGGLGGAASRQLAEYEVRGVLRQSTLDWLELRRRFSPEGEIQLDIRIETFYLRGPLAARWWPELGAPDRIAVRVRVRRGAEDLAYFQRVLESRVGGSDWADSEARAQRLARRLGQRVAEAFRVPDDSLAFAFPSSHRAPGR